MDANNEIPKNGRDEGDQDRRRRSSLERYRPGGGGGGGGSREGHGGGVKEENVEDYGNRRLPSEPGQEEGDERRNRRGGYRGGGGWGRGGRGGYGGERGGGQNGAAELGSLMGNMSLGGNDLRHRLDQRGREQQQQPENRENHRRVQGRGVGGTSGGNANRARMPKRNTENFNPSHAPPDLRVHVANASSPKFNREMTSRDVVIVQGLFCQEDDLSIYEKLLKELQSVGGEDDRLWQSWHGDSHLIADDKKRWKTECPTFGWIIEKMRDYFDMDVKATRLNWYRDSNEWKPFHHDAAAVKPDKARTQNFTVAVSFGMEREVAFEHAKTKTVISMPQPNGTIYTFGKDVNIQWRHGILQVPQDKFCNQGRLSIIAWGWNDQRDE